MRYHAALTNLCDALMPSFAEALGLNANFFEDKFRFPTATLRPLRYSAHPSRPSDGVLGAGAHSDYGVLTVLWTDGTEGLEIRKDDVWWPVKPLPKHRNAFICNVGDLCERWTNGVFKSTVHRVVTRRDESDADGESDAVGNRRHSCAFSGNPTSTRAWSLCPRASRRTRREGTSPRRTASTCSPSTGRRTPTSSGGESSE